MKGSIVFLLLLCRLGCTEGFKGEIPDKYYKAFTLNDSIPVSYESSFPLTSDDLNADSYLCQALDDLASFMQGKEVAIMSSSKQKYEKILLAYKAHPVVIDEFSPSHKEERVAYLTTSEYLQNPRQFDLILNLSNIASAGMQDDQFLDPVGDLKCLEDQIKMLSPGGKLLVSLPVGEDRLIWNSHRIYGKKRLKMLFQNWRIEKYYGFTSQDLYYDRSTTSLFLLRKK
jgi:hypothetical protein